MIDTDGSLPEPIGNGSYYRATVTYGTFVGKKFSNTDFRRLEGRLVSFERCTFLDCNFSNANLTYSRFIDCAFEYSDDFEISDASFTGAYFENTTIRTQGRLRFKQCNLRDVHFVRCQFGTIDFTSNGLEDSFFDNCAFDEIDIRSVAATALMFADCKFGLVRVSLENFALIIGSSSLLTVAKRFELSKLTTDDKTVASTSVAEAVPVVRNYVERGRLSAFEVMNAHIQTQILTGRTPNIDELNSRLLELDRQSPLCFFDQISNIIKLLEHYELLQSVDLKHLAVLFQQNRTHITRLPHSLAMRVRAAEEHLFGKQNQEFEVTFVFRAANADSSEDRAACYEFVHTFKSLNGLDNTTGFALESGSFKLSEVISLSRISPWVVAMVVLANSSQIKVNFDINKLGSDVISAASQLAAAMRESELEALTRESKKLDLLIEIKKKKIKHRDLLRAEGLSPELVEAVRLYVDQKTRVPTQLPNAN